MKTLIALTLLVAFALLSGCTPPINTQVEVTAEPLGFSYNSEKDISYERIVTDPESGVVESVKFSANASDPASVQAKANADLAAAVLTLGQSLGNNAQQVLTPSRPLIPAD